MGRVCRLWAADAVGDWTGGVVVCGLSNSLGGVILGGWERPRGMVAFAFAYAFLMRVRVLYFAVLKDVFGREREELELPAGATVKGLLEELAGRGSGAA